MPNWTDTTYKFKGTKEQAQDLKRKLDCLQSCEEPRVKSDFGNMWCGCLVDILGGKWDEVPCRGEICEHEIDGDTVTMRIEFAWSEPPAFRHFIESRYEGSKVFYTDEEPMMGIFNTNDAEGEHFHVRYVLECEGMDTCREEFWDIEDCSEWLKDEGIDNDGTFSGMKDAIDRWNDEMEKECGDDDEPKWISLNQYNVLDN